jgi:hypothetical protein
MVPSVGFPLGTAHELNGRILAFTAWLACGGIDLRSGSGHVRVPLQSERSSEGRQPQRHGRRRLAPHAEPAGDRRSGAGHGRAGGRRAVRAQLPQHPRHPSGVRFGQRSVRAVLHRNHGLYGRPDRAVLRAAEGADAGGPGSGDGVLHRFRAAEHHSRPLQLRERGGIHAGGGRIHQREPRPGVAGLLCHHADSAAGRPRFQRARPAHQRSGDDRQPGVRQAVLPGTESAGT